MIGVNRSTHNIILLLTASELYSPVYHVVCGHSKNMYTHILHV